MFTHPCRNLGEKQAGNRLHMETSHGFKRNLRIVYCSYAPFRAKRISSKSSQSSRHTYLWLTFQATYIRTDRKHCTHVAFAGVVSGECWRRIGSRRNGPRNGGKHERPNKPLLRLGHWGSSSGSFQRRCNDAGKPASRFASSAGKKVPLRKVPVLDLDWGLQEKKRTLNSGSGNCRARGQQRDNAHFDVGAGSRVEIQKEVWATYILG
jgi:hypothetical protein